MGFSTCTCFCICFPMTSLLFSLPCYSMLYPWLYILYSLAIAASHSLLSKCCHISFKCTVFISHSLCPSPSSPHLPSFSEENLNMSWRDQSPDIYSTASPLLIFSPLLYFSSNCLIRILLSTIGYQRGSTRGLFPCADLWFLQWGVLFVHIFKCKITHCAHYFLIAN